MITKIGNAAVLAASWVPTVAPIAAAVYNNKDHPKIIGKGVTAQLDPDLSADLIGGALPASVGLVGGSLGVNAVYDKIVGKGGVTNFVAAAHPDLEATPEKIDALYKHMKLDKTEVPTIRHELADAAGSPAYEPTMKQYTPEEYTKALKARGASDAFIDTEKALTKAEGNPYKNKGRILVPTTAKSLDLAILAHEMGHATQSQNKLTTALYDMASTQGARGKIVQPIFVPATGMAAYYRKLRQLEGKDDSVNTALGAVPVATAIPQATMLAMEGDASLRGYLKGLKNGLKVDKEALKAARGKLLRAGSTYGATAAALWGLPYLGGTGLAHLSHYLKEKRRKDKKVSREERKQK